MDPHLDCAPQRESNLRLSGFFVHTEKEPSYRDKTASTLPRESGGGAGPPHARRQGGRLVFTLEHALGGQEAAPGYRIQPHGRYTHTEAYVRGSLAEAGFELIEIGRVHLRREGGRYVEGLLVAARAALTAAS